jgi:hypothetical protein
MIFSDNYFIVFGFAGALIQQSVRVKEKDIRQFLDGIYVSDKRMPMTE